MNRVTSRTQAHDMARLFLLAAGLRILAALCFRNMIHPDEIYQVLEQSHRLVFGYGIVPWEFEDGLRSLVLPGLLAAPLWLLSKLSKDPAVLVTGVQLCLAILSSLPVLFVYRAGARVSRTHAMAGAFVAAVWFEAVYFSYHPLTETVAGTFLLLAFCELSSERRSPWAPILLGGFAALALGLRAQLAPAVVVMALFLRDKSLRTFGWIILGTLVPALGFGLVDWLTWRIPFVSYLNYFRVNLLQSKASTFGTEDGLWYLRIILSQWSLALPFLAVGWFFAWRRYASWIIAATALIFVHSWIPHKEYRFIEPALYLLAIAAGFGSAECLAYINRRRARPVSGLGLAALWGATSLGLALSPSYAGKWRQQTANLSAALSLYHDPQLCGLLVFDHAGGYSYLHRNLPLFWDNYQELSLAQSGPAFNAILADEAHAPLFEPAYPRQRCFPADAGELCIFERVGGCRAVAGYPPLLEQRRFGETRPTRKAPAAR